MQIWDNVAKPEAHKDTALSDFFNVSNYALIRNDPFKYLCIYTFFYEKVGVTALPSFEEKEEQFKQQVFAKYRNCFIESNICFSTILRHIACNFVKMQWAFTC